MKPSIWTRRGMKLIKEDQGLYLGQVDGVHCGCGLGATLVGKLGIANADTFMYTGIMGAGSTAHAISVEVGLDGIVPDEIMAPINAELVKNFRKAYETPPYYGEVVNMMHACGFWSTEKCAKWLQEVGL